MSWTLKILGTKPPHGLSLNHRAHWATKNRETQKIRDAMVWQARAQKIPVMQRMQVELVQVVKDRRVRDADNLAPMLKAAADGLASSKGTSARLVADDSPEFCVKLMPRIEYEPGCTPHFRVIVTDISNRPESVDQLLEERDI